MTPIVVCYGRTAPACGRGAFALTLKKAKVTCPTCRVELSGKELLRAFQRDLEEVSR